MDEHGSPGALGSIGWEITEASSGETIHRGRREIGRGDIEVVEIVPLRDRVRQARSDASPSGKVMLGIVSAVARSYGALVGLVTGGNRSLYRKRIHLDGDFYLSFADKPVARREALVGFGLVAEHDAVPTFSWEWFNVAGGQEHATKLQEGGELRIWMEKDRSGDWEVGYTEFSTDISLRMEPREAAGRDSKPRWRVRILEGSRVSWPSADEASGSAQPPTSP